MTVLTKFELLNASFNLHFTTSKQNETRSYNF